MSSARRLASEIDLFDKVAAGLLIAITCALLVRVWMLCDEVMPLVSTLRTKTIPKLNHVLDEVDTTLGIVNPKLPRLLADAEKAVADVSEVAEDAEDAAKAAEGFFDLF